MRTLSETDWQPIETAPKDGRQVDLMFPFPRGRTINCAWNETTGWHWRIPTWKRAELLPEKEWQVGCYPHMEPTHWMYPPETPK